MRGGDKFWGINRDEKRSAEQSRKNVKVSKSISTYNSAQLNLREPLRVLSSDSRYFYVVTRLN